jgi:hypothetical protein
VEKFHQRLDLARRRIDETGIPVAYVNQVGGQDELVFDGGSFVINADGAVAQQLPFWRESLTIRAGNAVRANTRAMARLPGTRNRGLHRSTTRWCWACVTMSARTDSKAWSLGSRAGIDSALTAAVAVDALGAAGVRGVRLPSRFTSAASMNDAEETPGSWDSARHVANRIASGGVRVNPSAALFRLPRDVSEENLRRVRAACC